MREVFQLFSTEFTETRDMRREMSEKAATSKSPTEHPPNSNTFVALITGDCSVPHGVGMAEGHVLGLEILQRFILQRCTVGTQFCLPKVCDVSLDEDLEGFLARGILEEQERMREVVGEAVGSDISKPVPTTLA